ncbi:MAG TPA: PGPGW domain-containing protein [Nevskiaceae bacterium]|nr:PGPGW domain-containing protein [Nevskiaceae bacterium]
MESLGNKWKRIPVAVRKPLVFIVGSTVVITGIAMLVLPGPGWAAIFLGFAILATEFTLAEKVRDWLVDELKKIIARAGRAWRKLIKK